MTKTQPTPEPNSIGDLIDITDKVADVKQMCTIVERYLFGFSLSWDHGYVDMGMISEELNIVSDLVVKLNLDIEDVKKRLNDYLKVSKEVLS